MFNCYNLYIVVIIDINKIKYMTKGVNIINLIFDLDIHFMLSLINEADLCYQR